MNKAKVEVEGAGLPMEALLLECHKDRYKLSYTAIRWAKEIKQKENLPDSIPYLVPRALREILTGKVTMAAIEKLPMIIHVAPPPPPPTGPTLTLNIPDADKEK